MSQCKICLFVTWTSFRDTLLPLCLSLNLIAFDTDAVTLTPMLRYYKTVLLPQEPDGSDSENIFSLSLSWCARWPMRTDRFRFTFVSKSTQSEWSGAHAQASASHLARCLEPDHLKCDTGFLRALRRPRLISAKPHGSLKVARLIAFNMNCIWFRHTSGFTFPQRFTTAVNWYNCYDFACSFFFVCVKLIVFSFWAVGAGVWESEVWLFLQLDLDWKTETLLIVTCFIYCAL